MNTKQVPVSLEKGKRYRFRGILGPNDDQGKPRWAFPPSEYLLLGVAKDYRTAQDRVVYEGVLPDHDLGKMYVCGYADWVDYFTLME